ncbi:hypothetical protein [Novosphingobium sp.]|uniref:hypothetical protein n=1 Tax=Novosphingobium sp. TaxID=1874826 RepID=UPI003BA8B869
MSVCEQGRNKTGSSQDQKAPNWMQATGTPPVKPLESPQIQQFDPRIADAFRIAANWAATARNTHFHTGQIGQGAHRL